MKQRLRSRARLHIGAPIVGDLLRASACAAPNETGGILLGHSLPAGALVTVIVGPGPRAKHERTSYDPDQDWPEREVASAFRDAPGLEYLGDWHSHPGGAARLSPTDRRVLTLIAHSAPARCPRPFMVLISGDLERIRIAAFRFDGGRASKVRIACVPAEVRTDGR